MSQNLEKLKRLLAEVFQLDQAELDFGIYRIMNAKREEITRFLDNDLLPQVREVLSAYERESRVTLEAELKKAKEQAKALGFNDPGQAPKVKELQARYNAAFDIEAAENEVFSHLYNFFRRYYSEGDFISLRRYKEGVYAIPYEGEEVKLHWANHDQYYIKTSEYLRDYTFTLPSGKRVHFKLVQADTEKDNNRAANGNERRFILSPEQPLAEEHGELVIRFEYRPHPDKAKQADLNAGAVDRILNQTTGFDHWRQELASPRPTEKNSDRTLLEKHLTDYTARNTFDYFIHKDLGGFLRRELDFYIKNEVMHLDDVESDTAPRVEQYLSKIKAIRRIAHKLIDFLAQIEDFQKKLWLKKKFVVETQYCITLDRVFAIEDEKARDWLVDQIVKNDPQREEWVDLCAIDEIKGDLASPGYSNPLKPEFLKAHPTLVADTRHFDEAFKLRLLAAIRDLDEETEGLLIHGDNFQALALLEKAFRGRIHSVYADPPYNTGNDGFTYKDRYQHSTWLSMVADRLALMLRLATDTASMACSIDENEFYRLGELLETYCPRLLGTVVVQNNPKGRFMDMNLSTSHEYLVVTALGPEASLRGLPRSDEAIARDFPEQDDVSRFRWIELRNTHREFGRHNRPNLWYPLYVNTATGEVFLEQRKGTVEVWPSWDDGFEGCWTWGRELATAQRDMLCGKEVRGRVKVFRKARAVDEQGRTLVEQPKTIWLEPEVQTEKGQRTLDDMFGRNVFRAPKPVGLIQKWVHLSAPPRGWVLDAFAGSGTTGHACVDLAYQENARRNYLLVEMGREFYEVLLPRLKKAVYSKEWQGGKPASRDGTSHMFKYFRLESYEDTLNNLELKRTEAQQTLLEEHPAFREDYTLRYMLDVESRGSASLLNIDRIEDPFNYKLDIATGTAGETKPTVVDLVETFNYLIGLRVKTIDHIGGVRVVTGTNPQGERVLILWRKTKELDNDALDAWFRKQGYNTKDQEYDVIYVNGDNNLENLRKADQTWKVRLIEEEFRRLMFDVQDV